MPETEFSLSPTHPVAHAEFDVEGRAFPDDLTVIHRVIC